MTIISYSFFCKMIFFALFEIAFSSRKWCCSCPRGRGAWQSCSPSSCSSVSSTRRRERRADPLCPACLIGCWRHFSGPGPLAKLPESLSWRHTDWTTFDYRSNHAHRVPRRNLHLIARPAEPRASPALDYKHNPFRVPWGINVPLTPSNLNPICGCCVDAS